MRNPVVGFNTLLMGMKNGSLTAQWVRPKSSKETAKMKWHQQDTVEAKPTSKNEHGTGEQPQMGSAESQRGRAKGQVLDIYVLLVEFVIF